MKKFLTLLLTLLLLLPAAALADELSMTWKAGGSKKIDAAAITDGSDETVYKFASAKSAEIVCDLESGDELRMVYIRMDCAPAKVELQFLNSSKKWETAATVTNPGPECVIDAGTALTGRVRLVITHSSSRNTPVTELRGFSDGNLPEGLHDWSSGEFADVLVLVDSVSGIDMAAVAEWTQPGRSVAIASLTTPKEGLLTLSDALWEAGLRHAPIFGGYAESTRTAANALKNWGEKKVTATVASWLRSVKPMLVVDAGEVTALVLENASVNAVNPDYELDDAAEVGLWAAPASVKASDASAAIQSLGERDDSLLREICLSAFDSAVSSDTALIPYPDNRDGEGYLTEGEFLFEDAEQGLWAYLSPTVQVEIVQYDMEDPDQRYFVAEVKFDPETEMFKQHTWVNATFKGQQIYPQTLAQTSKMVIAINGDYYPYRVDKNNPVGNVLRNYEVLYNIDKKRNPAFPPLDTLALHDDGTISVWGTKEITADELAARGDVHDALSFGPYLARDGVLRIYNGKNASLQEPRCAIGMISAGHYIIIDCEGRVPKGPKGMTVNQIGMLLYGYGCTDAFMLDGGSTSVLIFMGEKLNRTGKDTSIGSPRNQHELFGVGYSDLVHTDWVDGKPTK